MRLRRMQVKRLLTEVSILIHCTEENLYTTAENLYTTARNHSAARYCLQCCMDDQRSLWKMVKLACHNSETPEPVNTKFATDDYVGDVTPHAKN